MPAQLNRYLQTYKEGAVFCEQGDEATDFFILVEGKIGVYVNKDQVAVIDQPGTYIGEMAAILKDKRSATLKAEAETRAIALPASSLPRVIANSPDVGMKIMSTLARRLAETTEKLAELENKMQ